MTTTITNSYVDGTGLYYLGQIVGQTTVQGANTQTLANTFAWYAGPERTQTVVSGTGALSNGTTAYTLDAFGVTTGTSTTGGTTGSTSYLYDAAGQGVVRTETSGASSWRDTWYRMGGTNMWHYSNRFDPRVGGAESGQYAVQAGETMRTIAQNLWGDADLWYKIAEANGLGANAELTENQKLIIPSGVWRTHQNAQTYIPYDAGKFLTDTTPTPLYPAPAPPGHGGQCGVFGKILLVVIAVAVTAVTYGSLGPVASATLGSVASQAVGVATGIQEKFSFKSVALAAVTAGVTKGLDKLGAFDKLGIAGKVAGSEVAGNAARGALTNAVSQGIGVATGLQNKFNWAGVAAAGIGAGVGGAMARATGLRPFANDLSARNIGAAAVTGMAGGIANAATRSLLTGTSFGDNVLAALPDVIGNTIGNLVAGGLAGGGVRDRKTLYQAARGTADASRESPDNAGNGATRTALANGPQGNAPAGGAKGDDPLPDIVVNGDPHSRADFLRMTDYQFGWYLGRAGNHSGLAYDPIAHQAFNQVDPNLVRFGAVNLSASPIVQAMNAPAIGNSSYMPGVSIGAYSPSLAGSAKSAFLTTIRPGEQLRDSSYAAFGNGHYGIGALKYAGSIAMRVGATLQLPFDLAVSGVRGNGLNPPPVDREDAAIISLALTGLAGLRNAGRAVAADSVGPGAWRTVNEAMSGRAAAYQSQITGRAGESYLVNGVKFDGFEAGTLLDAKGPGYATFVKDGEFRSFFQGRDSLLVQAQRQIGAANGAPITWHVAEPSAADAMRALLNERQVTGIKIAHTPVRP